ncbi:hypothetical protein [Streptomyces sp.]|uniref:hypothetical protein n=1 Tax=Streptomyces sp. TaxID=1931 RepID=UPI002D3FF44A|nr:hypothetical protein [Streptomyces sp.]HZF90432.1 hypothetical protein [Streptomyces sp.]
MSEPTSTPAPAPAPTDPPAAPAPTPPAPPAPAAPAAPAPAVDPAAEQRATEAEQAAQRAQAERDELLAALRSVLDPSGAAGEQDPAKLAEQAATERDAALAEARQLRVELAAHQAAHKAGADPARLLDSRTVEKQLAALDPTDPKFAEQLDTVIAAAVEANPLLRAEGTAPAPPKGGADFTPGTPQTVTPEQFARMTYAQRVELHQSDPDLYARLSAASE